MHGLLHMVHAYQALTARAEHLRIPLDSEEQARLRELQVRLGFGEGEGTRRMPRVLCPWPVVLTLPGGFASARLRDLSGGGMCVRLASPPALGTRVLAHLAGPLRGEEFVFPAQVVWRREGDAPAVGLALVGVPSHSLPEGDRRRQRRHTPLVA
ncbi:MAG: PilZ domain-containing protein [Myxococcota bacterium]